MRVGSVETQKADVRIIAATNVDLKKMVAEGPVPRRPLLPPLRHHDLDSAAARAPRGHPAARRALRAAVRVGERQADRRHRTRTRCGRCSTTTGRATCGSSRTRSSAPSCSARRPRSRSTCCPRRVLQPDRSDLPVRLPGERLDLQGPRRGVRAAARPHRPAAHGRRPEARRRAPAHEAHDAPRDHQAAGDPEPEPRLTRLRQRGLSRLNLLTTDPRALPATSGL